MTQLLVHILAQTGTGSGGGGGGGGGGFNIPASTLRFLFIALLLGWSGLMWLIRYLREQKKVRDARERESHRRLEALRTGRDAEPAAQFAPRMTPAPQRATGASDRELMERRQQQLRELRKKASGQQPTPIPARPIAQASPSNRSSPVPPSGGPATIELWPGGPRVVVGQAGRRSSRVHISSSAPSHPARNNSSR